MKIRKAFQGTVPENKILDTYSTSQTDTYSCNYVNNKTTGEILWINNNPSNSFAPQTINISNLSSYTYIDILYFVYQGNLKQCVQRHYYDSTYKDGELMSIFTYSGGGYMGTRQFVVNANSIDFRDNYDFVSSPSGSGMSLSLDNNWTIPYKIIGYK